MAKTVTVITPVQLEELEGWFEANAVPNGKPHVILFKRVSKDFKTQEGTRNETDWTPGTQLKHPNPNLKDKECGPGKYHFVSRPYFADEFRSTQGDKYIAVEVPVTSLYAWPNPDYPHKIGGTEAKVLYECDRFGRKK